ncbi:MAG: hypothetical protein PHE49_04165 [bacterium]|nr:hypothetical protein [bacterium]
MKRIAMLILLLPLYVSADVGFHPRTTNNLLNFSLLQTADTNENNTERKAISFKYPVEIIGGILGGALGGIIGIEALTIMLNAKNDGAMDYTNLIGFFVGGTSGILFGTPAGVAISGKIIGDKGVYGKSFAGTVAGTLIGVLIGVFAGTFTKNVWVGLSVGSIFPIAGAVWGYNL